MANSKFEYVKSFETENYLLPATWIVLRIDGCHFHKFSQVHCFDKPNDENALHLLNECARDMFEEFSDIVFAYGMSDEYSFVFKKGSTSHQRRASKITSITVSFFSSSYVMKWPKYFQHKPLQYPPSFDARVVCYPSVDILRDYLAWRQVDCHINNQYNTCFWMLVKDGMSTREAQNFLKGTQTQEKNELLFKKFGINYNTLPAIHRKGSCIFRNEVKEVVKCNGSGDPIVRRRKKIVEQYIDIISNKFWDEHPYILSDETRCNVNQKKVSVPQLTQPKSARLLQASSGQPQTLSSFTITESDHERSQEHDEGAIDSISDVDTSSGKE